MYCFILKIYCSESESDIGYRSSVSDQESQGGLFEKRLKKINKARWTKEEVGFQIFF
jgi:hypothetical protein